MQNPKRGRSVLADSKGSSMLNFCALNNVAIKKRAVEEAVLGWVGFGLWGLEVCLRGEKGERKKLICLQTFPPNPFSVLFFCPPIVTRL
jgi:hypothetical protein